MAKKINVYVAEECDRYYPHQDEDITVFHHRDEGFHPVKATLVVGDERVFTESEVRSLLMAILKSGIPANPGDKYTFHGSGVIRNAAKKIGIDLDKDQQLQP